MSQVTSSGCGIEVVTVGIQGPAGSGSINPGGNDGNVQFNDSGTFGGSDNLHWDNVTSLLKVTGDIEVEDPAQGLILESPNGTRWRLHITDAGALDTNII